MKIKYISLFALFFMALILALVIANFSHPVSAAQNLNAVPSLLQTTPTPATDNSVIGSTDGVMLMGVVISTIIMIPLLFRTQKESNKTSRN